VSIGRFARAKLDKDVVETRLVRFHDRVAAQTQVALQKAFTDDCRRLTMNVSG
jgi:hypothetical protein